ncbi:MAG: hypothetical protein SO124_08720 [Oscillospiraceae bacterium]|nr:hypothetical protein [Oscillospiraceae bacterium]
MNEVRRPASAGNLKPAAHRLIFLRVYPRRDHVRGAVLLVGSVRAAVGHHGRFYISFRTIFEEEGKEKHEKSTCTPARSRDAAGRADRLRQQK